MRPFSEAPDKYFMHFAYSETLHYILATLDLVGSQMMFGPFSEAPDKYFMHFTYSEILHYILATLDLVGN